MEALVQRVRTLRASIESSEGCAESTAAVLGSYEQRLSDIDAAMRPIQVSRQAAQRAHDNIDRAIRAANDILAQVVTAREAEATILKGPHEDLESYLKAVDRLKQVAGFFTLKDNFKNCERFLNDIKILLSKSSLMIEEEFKNLMIRHSTPVEPDLLLGWPSKTEWAIDGYAEASGGNSGDSKHPSKSLATAMDRTPAMILPRIVPLLNALAQRFVQDGNQQSCYRIYRDARRSALELSLRKLGVEKLSKDDVERMQLDALEAKIGKCTQFLRIAMRLLLPGERKLCDEVFDGISFNKDQCFAELAGPGVLTLLSFVDAFAKSKRSPEKLFVLLDIYEVMHVFGSEVEVILQDSFCSEIRGAALGLVKLLAQTAQETFVDFEKKIEKDTSKTNIHDGTVHPLTIYAIDHVKCLFDYQSTLKLLVQEFETGSDTEFQLGVVLTKIMQALKNNLDGKSKQYKDPALMCIFLANNVHYMVTSVRRSEAKNILGEEWIQRHRRIVQQNANQYKRVAWSKVLQTLSVQGASSTGMSTLSDLSSSGVSRAMIKERFKSFNMQFGELHAKQSLWTIPDQELRETLRLAIAEVLLPAYRSFVKRFGNLVENEKKPHKYLKYSPEEVEELLDELFEGQQSGESKK
ncbi:exocyst complex component EXO70A1-like [Lolium rigidum]|uniref:exocyst complex component EXO70A1-like n=1 Tax=Lolium rigidum TaxID=89674 RepID=UPI001F5CEBD0|nr:exocyst complex component EXO70A1-like [Lolium rigidum]